MKKALFAALSVMILIGMASVAYAADNLFISTEASAKLGGLSFEDGDVVEYNPTTHAASVFFDEGLFSNGEDVDAFHLLGNGNYLLSTTGSATLGGLSFEDGDIIEYNPTLNTSSLFFDEGLFSHDEDIDAMFLQSNGNLVLSTSSSAQLGGLGFTDGDLVEYNPATKVSSLFFDEDLFSSSCDDIDALHVLSNGNLILSTKDSATLGGLAFEDGDLAEYNPYTKLASLYFNEDLFSNNSCRNADINAFSMGGGTPPPPPGGVIPEPATTLLLILGLFGGLLKSKRKGGEKRI